MTSSTAPVIEGIFAIHKPPEVTSYDVIRTLQPLFNTSHLFAPLLARNLSKNTSEPRTKARFRRDKKPLDIKIGHGGTLDPIATGVLIIGVGNGTKKLQRFLECTKEYETTVLFGAATDTYDRVGKVVGRAECSHVTEELVKDKLGQFRGSIMQKPSIFSAIRVNGKRMYEYAREGGEVPEMQARPLEVEKMELVKFLEAGTHKWIIPKEEASKEEKEFAGKMLHLKDGESSLKRKREEQPTQDAPLEKILRSSPEPATDPTVTGVTEEFQPDISVQVESTAEPQTETTPEASEPLMSGALQPSSSSSPSTPPKHPGPPAAILHMTVSSGFYVRSLCHDLGLAVGSLGLMSSLVRTRQGEFELGKNVLEYEDLEKGEAVWGPKVEGMLREWMEREGVDADAVEPGNEGGGRERTGSRGKGRGGSGKKKRQWESKDSGEKSNHNEQHESSRRRNTSSPE